MSRGGFAAPLWVLFASLLLAVGFLLYVSIAARFAAGDAAAVQETREALVIYARVVLVKGLLPQLWLCLALWPAAERSFALCRAGRPRVGLGLAGCALAAGLVVVPLLAVDVPGWPGVVYQGVGNFLATLLEMSAAVGAAAWLARWPLYSP